MQKTAIATLAAIFALGTSVALAQGDPTPGKPGPRATPSGPPAANAGDVNGNFVGRSRGQGKLGYLTPQQQAVLAHEPGGEAQLRRLGAMSQNDRLKLQTRLQKTWDKLPQPEKDRLQAQLGATMTRQDNGVSPGKSDAETAGASSPAGSSAMKKDINRR